jgi:4-hydroxy-tetrahydrodipicolinate reductase
VLDEPVEIEEFGDLSRRDSPHMLFEQMGFGKPLSEFDPSRRAKHLLGEYGPRLRLLAEAAGFTVDEWAAWGEVAAARRNTKIVAGEIKAGTAAAQRATLVGRSSGADVVSFTALLVLHHGRRAGVGPAAHGLARAGARRRAVRRPAQLPDPA